MQLLIFNEEFLVDAVQQTASITSLPFVHTARRTYRLNGSVKSSDWVHLFGVASEKLIKSHHLEEGEVVTRFLRNRNEWGPSEGSFVGSLMEPERVSSRDYKHGATAEIQAARKARAATDSNWSGKP